MRLDPLQDHHIPELMKWFPDRRSVEIWATREFRYPFTAASFAADVHRELPSWLLVGDGSELLGFGQYYLRVGRCHLARLVIAPVHRGRALGAALIRELARLGCRELQVDVCSLFVLEDNAPALALYRRLGFVEARYPETPPAIEHCAYMIAPLATIGR